ncbi:histidine phosphatase family protein [Nonomuraea sp. NPDC050153]|uniref:histidine phosphatase family protein n=1 Tax=Nonomuraea sp. NPDC050153 TaxID=3364359 RepID=UPI0037AB7B53
MGVRVLCLRHAESENVVAQVAGALPLAELTPKGRAQAAEAAERLLGEGVTRIYASTAVRARPRRRDGRPSGWDGRAGRACRQSHRRAQRALRTG